MQHERFDRPSWDVPGSRSANIVPVPFTRQGPVKDKYLRSWKLVKRARFNAAKRLERKQNASIMTLAVVAFYTGSASLFTLTFRDALPGQTRTICEFVSQFFSVLTLIIGLIEQLKDYPSRARELHDCARKINALQKHLEATHIEHAEQLLPYLQSYDQCIAECRHNHDDVDYGLAQAMAPGHAGAERDLSLWLAKAAYHASTYAFYASIWIAPPIVALTLWLLLPAPG